MLRPMGNSAYGWAGAGFAEWAGQDAIAAGFLTIQVVAGDELDHGVDGDVGGGCGHDPV